MSALGAAQVHVYLLCGSDLAADYDVESISNSTLSDYVVAVLKLNLDR